MADIIAFPKSHSRDLFASVRALGAEQGIGVRILSRAGTPGELFVVLDGTAEGSTTVASVPLDALPVAELIAHSTLATLKAAGVTWGAPPPSP